jgi:hypothetical protein
MALAGDLGYSYYAKNVKTGTLTYSQREFYPVYQGRFSCGTEVVYLRRYQEPLPSTLKYPTLTFLLRGNPGPAKKK